MKTLRLCAFAVLLALMGLNSFSIYSFGEGTSAQDQGCTVTVRPGQSIQQAIDQAQEGDVICLAQGTWEENVKIEKSLTLRGAGQEKTTIKGQQEGYPIVWIESDFEIEVTIESLKISDAKGTDQLCAVGGPEWICPDGILVRGTSKVMMRNVKVSGNKLDGLRVRDSVQLTLENSTISRNRGPGLRMWESATVSLTGSQVSDNMHDGLWVNNSAQVSLNTSIVSGNRAHALNVWDSAQVTVKNSIIRDNKGCGLYVVSEQAKIEGGPNEMQGNGADLCGYAPPGVRQPLVPQTSRTQLAVPDDYPTLQEAIDAIAPGGTITMAARTYQEGLTIWKPLHLQGAGREATELKAPPEGYPGVSIISEAEGVIVEGLTITGSQGAGLLIYGQAEIAASTVSENWLGLVVESSAQATLKNSTISENRLYGLSAGGSAKVSLENSMVSSNHTGLDVGWSATVILSDSTVSDNRSGGLSVWGSAQVTLEGSTVSRNGRHGLEVWESAQTTLVSSTVSENEYDGLFVKDSAQVTLRISTVSENGFSGLSAWNSTRVTVFISTIENNGTDPRCKTNQICNGIEVRDESQMEIQYSFLRNNTDWGLTAWLEKCGYDYDNFTGEVIFQGINIISDNNTSNNQDGLGNPGNHPWNRPEVPDGQVCLP